MGENENLMDKILNVLKEYLNIGRKLPVRNVSMIHTATYR